MPFRNVHLHWGRGKAASQALGGRAGIILLAAVSAKKAISELNWDDERGDDEAASVVIVLSGGRLHVSSLAESTFPGHTTGRAEEGGG